MKKHKITTGQGRVMRSTGSSYLVRTDQGTQIDCVIKGKFRQEDSRDTNPVVVGDEVSFMIPEGLKTGVITAIGDRKNAIIRKASNLSRYAQVIAANVDQALLIVSLKAPETQLEFIDRYLVAAESYRIPVVLVFNKIDLYDKTRLNQMKEWMTNYQEIGYKCVAISAVTGKNMEKIKTILAGKINLVSGNSGVGKSTMINFLDPSLNLTISEISAYHQAGKHTTTFAEMHELFFGGYIIDTPGIRGFGLVHIDKEEIYHFFPEIFRYASSCKYYNCRHINEPGCNVKKAVSNGLISPSRYQSYLNMYLDENLKYRK